MAKYSRNFPKVESSGFRRFISALEKTHATGVELSASRRDDSLPDGPELQPLYPQARFVVVHCRLGDYLIVILLRPIDPSDCGDLHDEVSRELLALWEQANAKRKKTEPDSVPIVVGPNPKGITLRSRLAMVLTKARELDVRRNGVFGLQRHLISAFAGYGSYGYQELRQKGLIEVHDRTSYVDHETVITVDDRPAREVRRKQLQSLT